MQIGSSGDDCQGKVLEAVFEYTGEETCPISNPQDGKAKCTDVGFAGGQPVSIAITKDEGKVSADPSVGIVVGDTFAVTKFDKGVQKEFGSTTEFDVVGPSGRQELEVHTSRSQTLNVGDQFGSVTLVELTTTEGGTVTLPDSDASLFLDACEAPAAPPAPSCTSKVLGLTLRYAEGECIVSNAQDGKADCDGGALSGDASITITKDQDKVSAMPSSGIGAGELFTIAKNDGKELGSETKFDASDGFETQSIKLHTSCSKPLNLGDRFGAFEVFSLDLKDEGLVSLGTEVEYQYTVTNPNADTLTVTSVEDDQLGELLAPDTLEIQSGHSVTLFETTKNTVVVSGIDGPSGVAQCTEAMDMVTVELVPPPGPPFVCSDAKPITTLTLIWDGPSGVDVVTEAGQMVHDVQNGEEVVIDTAGLGNDVDLDITGAVSGSSRFHVSCSDQEMNGPEDCGSAQGNGKGNDTNLLNDWLLEGIAGDLALDCTP
jgi:hypothetical protein